jgi:hypothetical protein
VVADAEHLHAGLVRRRQHLGAQRRLPDLHSCMWRSRSLIAIVCWLLLGV